MDAPAEHIKARELSDWAHLTTSVLSYPEDDCAREVSASTKISCEAAGQKKSRM